MMNLIRKIAGVVCLAGLAAAGGCAVADTGSFVRLQEEVEGLKQEVAAAKRAAAAGSVAAAPAPTEQTTPLRANPEEILALRADLANMSNTIDGVKSEVRIAGTRIDENKVDARKEISRLNGKTDEGAIAIQALKTKQAKIDEIDRRLASLEQRLEKALPAAGRGAAGASQSAPPEDWKSAEDMYDYALGTLKGGEAGRARSVFEAFLAKYPGHKLSPNVYYWRAESFYLDKDYDNAIIGFQDVIDKFPASDKAVDAMFKQGLSFQAQNDKKNAKTLFELILSRYPKSPVAEKAKQKLSEIK